MIVQVFPIVTSVALANGISCLVMRWKVFNSRCIPFQGEKQLHVTFSANPLQFLQFSRYTFDYSTPIKTFEILTSTVNGLPNKIRLIFTLSLRIKRLLGKRMCNANVGILVDFRVQRLNTLLGTKGGQIA